MPEPLPPGYTTTFADPPVANEDLASHLERVEAFLRRFLATLADFHFCVLSLWAAHTWVIEAAEATPYLHVTSAEIESGKTRVLEVLDLLVNRPAPLLDPSAASLYRGLDSGQIVTLLLDEIDNFLPGGKADSEGKRTILGILNGGYRRGLRVPRVTDGRNLEWFEVFGPKALTGIGALPHTLASRSLRIRMRRRRRDERIERFRRKNALEYAQPLADALAAWADKDVIATLAGADPELPDDLSDRQQDACELLVAIADLAGGDWPDRAREALVQMAKDAREAAADESRGAKLLADLQTAFTALGDRVATATLLGYLNTLDERPWGGWNDGTGLKPRNLAAMLKSYEVRSTTVALADGARAKGYKREDFADAFSRYLVRVTVTSVTPPQPCGFAPDSQALPDGAGNGYETAANPHQQTGVTEVTDSGGGKGDGDAKPLPPLADSGQPESASEDQLGFEEYKSLLRRELEAELITHDEARERLREHMNRQQDPIADERALLTCTACGKQWRVDLEGLRAAGLEPACSCGLLLKRQA